MIKDKNSTWDFQRVHQTQFFFQLQNTQLQSMVYIGFLVYSTSISSLYGIFSCKVIGL
jgi:hypothetical protein